VLQFERLRQEVEESENQAGSLADYLDRGHPNARERRQGAGWMDLSHILLAQVGMARPAPMTIPRTGWSAGVSPAPIEMATITPRW
jgi:hypothetical protein